MWYIFQRQLAKWAMWSMLSCFQPLKHNQFSIQIIVNTHFSNWIHWISRIQVCIKYYIQLSDSFVIHCQFQLAVFSKMLDSRPCVSVRPSPGPRLRGRSGSCLHWRCCYHWGSAHPAPSQTWPRSPPRSDRSDCPTASTSSPAHSWCGGWWWDLTITSHLSCQW